MLSKQLWATTATFLALSAVGPSSLGVWAQTTTMAVCNPGFQWNENSLLQDPCTVSSILDAGCRGIGSYTIPALNSTQNYVPPQSDSTYDLECDCNTIMYSLYMACTTCQGGIIYSWPKWITQCGSVYVTQYPVDIAYGTAIPHWAFYDVTTLPNETYSDATAQAAGRDPEATPNAISTATVKTSTNKFSTTSTPGSNPTGNSSGNSSSGSSGGSGVNIAAIVGGVVGGVVVLALIAVLVFFLLRRKSRPAQNYLPPAPPQMYPQETSEYQKVPPSPMPSPGPASPGIPNPGMLGMPTSPVLSNNASYYNPNDPTTFPPPMGDGHSSLSYPNTTPPHGQGGPGRYGGMPEL